MTFKKYLENSERTLSSEFNCDKKIELLLHGALGIATEADELLENFPEEGLFEKIRVYLGLSHKKFDGINAIEELGDITWYAAIFFREIDGLDYKKITPSQISSPKAASSEILSSSCDILDMLKKKIYYNKDYDQEAMKHSVESIMSNVMGICMHYNVSIYDVYEKNISKLKKRYPEKFSSEKAINRDLKAEREILES